MSIEDRFESALKKARKRDEEAQAAREKESLALREAAFSSAGRATNDAGVTVALEGANPMADMVQAQMSLGVNPVTGMADPVERVRTGPLAERQAAAPGSSPSIRPLTSREIVLPKAEEGYFEGLTFLGSSPQQFGRDFAYGAERLAAALLGSGESVLDIIGSGFWQGVSALTQKNNSFLDFLRGEKPEDTEVSRFAQREADWFLDNSITQRYEQNIRERYNPSKGAENLTRIEQIIVQMLPAIATGTWVSQAAGTGARAIQAADAARRGANASRAMFGLQAAGSSAAEARRAGASTPQALAYGVGSGLLETSIESIAGGIPGMGQGRITQIARAVEANPVVSRVLDIAGEGGEEALSTALTPYLQRAIYDPDAENATAEEIAESAVLGAVAAGVLQGGLELPRAVSDTMSDVRQARQEVGTNQDIIDRANERIAQDMQARREAGLVPPAVRAETGPVLAAEGQNNTASTGEAENRGETVNVVQSLRRNIPELSVSQPVYSVSTQSVQSATGRTMAEKARNLFEKIKGVVTRQGFGDIEINTRSVKDDLSHGIGPAKAAVIPSIPSVIQNGTQIDYQQNWKGRPYDGYVFAAPVSMDGDTVYVAAVVKRTSKNRFYLYEVVDSNGNIIKIGNEEWANPTSLAASGDAGTQSPLPSINSILPGGQDVNIQAVSPDSSVGAAPAGFDAYGRLIGKYGAIEPGENPAPHSYAVEVPRQTTANDRVSLSARTIMEAAVTPDAMIPDLAQMVVDGKFSRIPVSNKKSISNAETRIRQVGYQNALMSWIQDVKNGNVSEQTMAMGAVLYNNAATAGDGKTALDIAYYFAQAATQGARATQANRILKMLTPSGQLYMVQKMVNDVNDAVYDSRKNRPGNVPVELWMQRVGENLADELSSRLNVKPMEAKTVAQTILSDLRRYANETAPRRPTSRDTRTEMDRIMDLFQNRAAYEEAWQAAKDTLSDTFENNPDALSTFEAWLDSSLEYTRRLTKELTQQDQIVLPEELADRFLKAETNEARDAVLDEINQYIADQIPSTFLEKFNALRYINMLGNLKTQIRNVGGNAIMRAVRAGRVKVQAALESAAEKSARRKGREFERTTSATRDKEIYRLAMDEFDQAQAQIMGEQKYSYNGRPIPADIQNRRTIFRVNGTWGTSENSPARLLRRAADLGMSGLEGYRRLTNWSMETGDLLFARSAYADALSRYLKANGVTAEQYQNGTADPELMERARSHAVREAQEATFRDKNAFSDAISSIGFRRPKNNIEHAINMAVQGVLPFRRTPANVAVRAVEYSPLGLIGTVAKEFKRLKGNQNITSNDVISSLAKTLTGSGIMAIGGALGYFGLLTGMEGDDEEQNELNQQSGRQDYALYLPEFITDAVGLPKGFNFTLDWASPMSIPLFMGAELGAEVSKNGIQAKDFFDAIASSSNVLLDMSMLQGVNDQLTNISYSENPLVDLALNSLTDYLQSGFTSTFGGQLERSAEDVRMTTYTDENLELPTDVQYTIGSQLARVPGVDYQQIPYIDAWGREESSGTVLPRTFNQFLNPAYTSSDTATPAIEETQRLYDLTGDGGVVSERPEKEITVNGEEIYLNSGQYLQYATERGQERDRLVSSVIQSQAYQGLSAEDQVSVIKDIYSYTDAVAKSHISDYEPDGWIADAMESDLPVETFILFRAATSGITSDKDENGKTIPNSKKDKIMEEIDRMDLSDEEKDALYYAAGYKESTIDDAPWH